MFSLKRLSNSRDGHDGLRCYTTPLSASVTRKTVRSAWMLLRSLIKRRARWSQRSICKVIRIQLEGRC